MDHSLMAKFQSFLLRSFEKLSIKMAEADFTASMVEYNLCYVDYFIWGKLMNVKNYQSVMCQFKDRVFQLFFLHEDSRKKALEHEPWCFDYYLFIIKPWDHVMEAPCFDFEPLLTAYPYTFHISHLSQGYHTVEVRFKIASFLFHCSKFYIKQDKDRDKFF
ncbi:hypothetical protein M9H77_12385 [Catharanthus roseus]|uniref:Uncharacterized protein n=1 Tax=Catharanthus roseus TaxID=4058 RepID=A0ACC0BH97_CATRO|nr:hypothetical protein M9H77_12385 [Catharanthus roseus]